MKKVAIFDIDGTVFRSSLLIELVEGLIREGLFQESVKSEYDRELMAWRHREGPYDEYIDAVVRVFMTYIKGINQDDFLKVAERVVGEEQKRVYRHTRDLIEKLKADDYFLLAISQSPKMVLEPFCKALGFDKVYGRIYETNAQNRFTGEVTDVHLITDKANILKRAVEKENLTLDGSVGVGDTDDDISFLSLVDKPICFNPNSKLYKHGQREGWKVVVERKDVIYEL